MVSALWWRRAAACAGIALCHAHAGGQTPGAPPADDGHQLVRRVAASFTFEEEDNPYPVPRNWGRAHDSERSPRPGYPRFNEGEFDYEVAHSGGASVKLPTRGGSTALRLGTGVIPVFAEGDYAVTAWVRTEGLQHARAVMCARFLDQASRPIPGTEVQTTPVQTRGEWTEVSIELTGAPERATFLQIELELRQPRELGGLGAADAHRVWPEDLSGAAWFDDVAVHQLPRVEMSTGAPANIVLMPSKPVVKILVRDFVGEQLDGRMVVTDVDGRVVEDLRTSLATTGRPQEWAPTLPALGWYRVTLDVLGRRTDGAPYRVGGTELSFLWLPGAGARASRTDGGGRGDRTRFGIIADGVQDDVRAALPGVGRGIGTGFMTIPIWSGGVMPDAAPLAVAQFGEALDALSKAGQQVIACIPAVPAAVMRDTPMDGDDALGLARVEAAAWVPLVHPILDRFGQRLTRWQLGRAGTEGSFWNPDAPGAAGALTGELSRLVPGPRTLVPWRGEFALQSGMENTGLVLTYPAEFGAESLRSVVSPLIASRPGAEMILVPELPVGEVLGERAVVIEAARRVIEFWAARTEPAAAEFPLSVALSHPWRRVGERRTQLMPDPSLGVFRTLIDHLSDRRVIGEYPVVAGVKCYILADVQPGPSGILGGALVAWNVAASPGDAAIRRYLGDGPIQTVDMFGNRAAIDRSSEPGSPHVVPLGETPVFIEGVDPLLALFCTEMRVEPAFLPAVQTEHELALVVTNPWPHAISGKLQIVPPGESATDPGARRRWAITPDGIIAFSIGAGQSKRIPWTAAFPSFEETGEKHLSVVVRLATDRELPPVVIPITLRVGLQDLALEPDVQLGPRLDGPDVIVTAVVSNRGNHSRMLKLEAVAPGIPTQQTLIADLPGGEAVVKRIVLKNMAAQLAGRRIHLSLTDAEELERLNVSVQVP